MLLDQAEEALEPLLAATTGWTDEAVGFYVEQLSAYPNPRILATACLNVARTWRAPRRPPLAEITDAYRAEARRLELMAVPAVSSGSVCSLERGRAIALASYRAECAARDREPNLAYFRQIVGGQ